MGTGLDSAGDVEAGAEAKLVAGSGVRPFLTYFCCDVENSGTGFVTASSGGTSFIFSGLVTITGDGSTLTTCGGGFETLRGGVTTRRGMAGAGFGDGFERTVGFVSLADGVATGWFWITGGGAVATLTGCSRFLTRLFMAFQFAARGVNAR